MLLAFALILNVNASSAATVNNSSSINSNANTDLSSNMTQISTVSASASKSSTISNSEVTTTAQAVKTDTTKPKVKVMDPANKAVKVEITKTIKITFSEKIKFGSKWIDLYNSKSQKKSFKSSIIGNTLTITPINNFANGLTYYINIHTGSITDLSGNKVSLHKMNFTTVAKKPYPTSYSQYLKPTKNCQSTNSRIKSLAASITKGKTSELSKASAIFNWVRNHISYSFYYNTRKGALGTLSSRSANCADTAHIMVALERAAGIPARYNHGTCRFSSGHYFGHVWAQVYVNGKWYYADGTSSETHLEL